ncbi:hypothetical protein F4806DRAFT_499455 [Annulohypoxylon nitens]|nr:hypothetical protein F4806DRAFT_499455 [Annulohypoxylon nitens]
MATDQSSDPSAGYYSHEETVAAITSYYKLVQRAHAITNRGDLVHPPPEGWPQIDDPDLADGEPEYNEDCLKLMRHIPYFKDADRIQILPDVQPCGFIGYIRCSKYEEDPDQPYIPPFLMMLGAIPHEREYGCDCWLDTKWGDILVGSYHDQGCVDIGTEQDCIDAEPDDHSYDNLFYEYEQHGAGSAWRISTFFAACEKQLKELKWIPGMSEGEEGRIIQDETSTFSMLSMERRKQIMRDNGWPGDNWNPEAARAEVERSLQQICSERSDRSSGPAEETEERVSSRCSLM